MLKDQLLNIIMTGINQEFPESYNLIQERTQQLKFNMASDILMCTMLRSLAASKPAGKFLELGTGTGLSTSWILDGMDLKSSLVTIDNDPELVAVAAKFLGSDNRLSIVLADAHEWISENSNLRFDYIFADAWPGKYSMLDEVLAMLNEGGIYIIDDMLPQPNWPEGHDEKVKKLITDLESKDNLVLSKLDWSSGVILVVRK